MRLEGVVGGAENLLFSLRVPMFVFLSPLNLPDLAVAVSCLAVISFSQLQSSFSNLYHFFFVFFGRLLVMFFLLLRAPSPVPSFPLAG